MMLVVVISPTKTELSLSSLSTLDSFDHFIHSFVSLLFPLATIFLGKVQQFVTGWTKYFKLLKLLGQGDDVKVKESDFTLEPGK